MAGNGRNLNGWGVVPDDHKDHREHRKRAVSWNWNSQPPSPAGSYVRTSNSNPTLWDNGDWFSGPTNTTRRFDDRGKNIRGGADSIPYSDPGAAYTPPEFDSNMATCNPSLAGGSDNGHHHHHDQPGVQSKAKLGGGGGKSMEGDVRWDSWNAAPPAPEPWWAKTDAKHLTHHQQDEMDDAGSFDEPGGAAHKTVEPVEGDAGGKSMSGGWGSSGAVFWTPSPPPVSRHHNWSSGATVEHLKPKQELRGSEDEPPRKQQQQQQQTAKPGRAPFLTVSDHRRPATQWTAWPPATPVHSVHPSITVDYPDFKQGISGGLNNKNAGDVAWSSSVSGGGGFKSRPEHEHPWAPWVSAATNHGNETSEVSPFQTAQQGGQAPRSAWDIPDDDDHHRTKQQQAKPPAVPAGEGEEEETSDDLSTPESTQDNPAATDPVPPAVEAPAAAAAAGQPQATAAAAAAVEFTDKAANTVIEYIASDGSSLKIRTTLSPNDPGVADFFKALLVVASTAPSRP